MSAAKSAQGIQGDEFDLSNGESLEKYDGMMTAMDELTEARSAIILRAFGGQFGLEELDNVKVEEIDRVVEALQSEAYGIVRKNG